MNKAVSLEMHPNNKEIHRAIRHLHNRIKLNQKKEHNKRVLNKNKKQAMRK